MSLESRATYHEIVNHLKNRVANRKLRNYSVETLGAVNFGRIMASCRIGVILTDDSSCWEGGLLWQQWSKRFEQHNQDIELRCIDGVSGQLPTGEELEVRMFRMFVLINLIVLYSGELVDDGNNV